MLSVAIPSYREAENLSAMLPSIKEAALVLDPACEILVIDTQESLDDTAAVCKANGVRHIHRTGGNSYGDAIRTMVAESRGEYILCMDADGSHSPAYFTSMWAQREYHDIVIGSRYVTGGHTKNPGPLIAISWIANTIFRIAFSLPAKDVTNSFRLYRKSILTPMQLQSKDFDILEEILIRSTLRHPPARIVEVPVTFDRRKSGESKRNLFHFSLSYLKTLRRMRTIAKQTAKENQPS